VSILPLALQTRYLTDDRNKNLWAISLIAALRNGFAGSLSTVSTMVKEMFELQDEFPHHAKAYRYACLTVVVAILSSVMIYSPIVKSG
jgi:fluoride ion exporter CrcB/FEX